MFTQSYRIILGLSHISHINYILIFTYHTYMYVHIHSFAAQRWLVWSCLVQHSGGPISDTTSQLLLITSQLLLISIFPLGKYGEETFFKFISILWLYIVLRILLNRNPMSISLNIKSLFLWLNHVKSVKYHISHEYLMKSLFWLNHNS